MAYTPIVIQEAIFATPGGTSYKSDGCLTIIDKLTATNEGPAIAIITAQLISPDGQMIGSYSKSLQPGASWPFLDTVVGHTLAVGGILNMVCATASAVRWRASGRQITS